MKRKALPPPKQLHKSSFTVIPQIAPPRPLASSKSTSPSPNLTLLIEDQRSIANRLAASDPQNDDESRKPLDAEAIAGQSDPTAPAKMHGNEPSRGAKIDKQLQDEEAELIAKKDAAKGSGKSGGTGDVAGKKN